jgi:cytoskeletal protein CcmA (bactofilin family)
MWKRDDAVRPPTPPSAALGAPAGDATAQRPPEPKRQLERDTVNIGKSVVIKGELSGSEDLTIEGQVEGKIELRQNVLTIGPNGKIKAQVFAKAVIVLGEVMGNVSASERVDIRDNGSVDGDIAAPRVAIADGAHFRGSIDMQRGPAQAKPAEAKPEAKASPAPAPAQGQAQPAGPAPQPAGQR